MGVPWAWGRSRTMRALLVFVVSAVLLAAALWLRPAPTGEAALDRQLTRELLRLGFTGRVEATLEERLGRPVNPQLAEIGRLLFFDPVLSLSEDNSCSGCHGPNVSFSDSRPISIGVGNNGVVGPGRRGGHNQRRAPSLMNAAFYPSLMWDSRFAATSLDPFDNTQGFVFPEPEARSLSHMEHLLGAQAYTPVVNKVEMAGFEFDGDNDAMRSTLAQRIDDIEEYRTLFAELFADVGRGARVSYEHIGRALAEFEFTLVRVDAPIDRFARGQTDAMTTAQKQGALLFFAPDGGRTACVECHKVDGYASEMFSDFVPRVLAVPQIVPTFRNIRFNGPDENEDYGLEQQTRSEADRYKFRTAPLRNLRFQPTFMHNGAYTCVDDAIRHHLEVAQGMSGFGAEMLDASINASLGPVEPMLGRVETLLTSSRPFQDDELEQIVMFVRDALSDPGAHPDSLRALVPEAVPSGRMVHHFEFGVQPSGGCKGARP